MKFLKSATLVAVALALAACSQALKEPSARAYADPPEMKAVNDSVGAYENAVGDKASFEGYRDIYEHFIALNPTSTALQRDYQSIFDGFDKNDEKAEYYKKLYDRNNGSAMASYLYARTMVGDDATKLYRRSVELDPNYYWGNFGLASKLLNNTPPDTTEAMKYLFKCVDIDNSFPGAFQLIAGVYFARDMYDDAIKYADLFATTSPESFTPVKLKSDILMEKGDKTQAEAILKKFAEGHAKDTQSRRALIDMLRKQSRFADAITYQRQLVTISNQNPDVIFDIAKLFALAGEKDSALAYIGNAAGAGFSNYHRLSHSPVFDGVRAMPAYAEVSKKVQDVEDKQREMRLASFKDNVDTQKQQAVADKIEIPAPQFTFKNLAGKDVSLSDLKGKVVVIDFWATWCGPCRMTMPLLQQFVDRKPKDVEFLSVDVWEHDTSLVRPFLGDYGYEFNVLFGNTKVTDDYKVDGIPTVFVIDKDGVIRYKHIGYDPREDELIRWQTEALMSAT